MTIALALDASVDQVTYALPPLRTAGLVTTKCSRRATLYRLTRKFPQPLREHCLRRLVDLSTLGDGEEHSA